MEGFRGKVKRILDSVKGRTPTTIPHNLADWKYLPKRKLLTREPLEQTILRRVVKEGRISEAENYIYAVAARPWADEYRLKQKKPMQSLHRLTCELLDRSGLPPEYRERAEQVRVLIEANVPDLLEETDQ